MFPTSPPRTWVFCRMAAIHKTVTFLNNEIMSGSLAPRIVAFKIQNFFFIQCLAFLFKHAHRFIIFFSQDYVTRIKTWGFVFISIVSPLII